MCFTVVDLEGNVVEVRNDDKEMEEDSTNK